MVLIWRLLLGFSFFSKPFILGQTTFSFCFSLRFWNHWGKLPLFIQLLVIKPLPLPEFFSLTLYQQLGEKHYLLSVGIEWRDKIAILMPKLKAFLPSLQTPSLHPPSSISSSQVVQGNGAAVSPKHFITAILPWSPLCLCFTWGPSHGMLSFPLWSCVGFLQAAVLQALLQRSSVSRGPPFSSSPSPAAPLQAALHGLQLWPCSRVDSPQGAASFRAHPVAPVWGL